jgi:hypothetical protein
MRGVLHAALYLCETGFWECKTKYRSRLNASPVLRIQLPILKPSTKGISEGKKSLFPLEISSMQRVTFKLRVTYK